MTWIQTYTGRRFYPLEPRKVDVDILDIAHALSHICRYCGHTESFYSVAQHSCHVSDLLPRAFKAWGLLHDAGEAYLADLAAPIKHQFESFEIAEGRIICAIADQFGLSWPMPENVKYVDYLMLKVEKRDLLPRAELWPVDMLETLDIKITPWDPLKAKQEFMYRANMLGIIQERPA